MRIASARRASERYANSSTTRRVLALFFSIFATRTAPISAVFADVSATARLQIDIVHTQQPHAAEADGGLTLIDLTSCGLARISSSLIHSHPTGAAVAINASSCILHLLLVEQDRSSRNRAARSLR